MTHEEMQERDSGAPPVELQGATATTKTDLEVVPTPSSLTQIEQSRAVQEVQAAVLMAKKFPRDENAAYTKIMTACQRINLAEKCVYSYPKGGQQVIGPSIYLARAIAKIWGNLDVGIKELSQSNGESEVETYCWDLETNYKERKVFTVKHERHTKRGTKTLTDPRDIYEMVANLGARRQRACILGVIPQDVVDDAVDRCYKTMAKGKGNDNKPLKDRVRELCTWFEGVGVDKKLLEKRLGHGVESMDETELVKLRMIATGLKDGLAKREDYFDLSGPEGGHANAMNEEFKKKKVEESEKAQTKTK